MKHGKTRYKTMQSKGRIIALSTLLLLLSGTSITLAETPKLHPAIPLYDEDGSHVLDSAKPYSPKKSCGNGDGGGCHDYESITHAFHMEQGRDEASDEFGKRIGLDHLVSPGYFGGYNCMGGNSPEFLAKKVNTSADAFADLGSAGWIQRCSTCHSGGGWEEKDRNGRRYDEVDPETVAEFDGDYYNRGTTVFNTPTSMDTVSMWDWKKSGVVENDCFMCHYNYGDIKTFDPILNEEGASNSFSFFSDLRNTKLIKGGYFRYAGTAILEFMNLNTSGDPESDVNLVTFDRHLHEGGGGHGGVTPGYDLNVDENNQPILNWNSEAFDEDRKATIPMVSFPGSANCMQCHRTAYSRRGFPGIGFDYLSNPITRESDGDVHYTKNFTENNGETRVIEDCNGCHSREYYRPGSSNVALDADHNFPKGNSDNDIRNDLDFSPAPLTCLYCHDTAENPAIPSGHTSMLNAHREKWKLSGDMDGYPMDSLDRITQTHLDVVSCEACHITGTYASGRSPIKPLFRYRRTEEGNLKISPYNAKQRNLWKDKTSGYVLNKNEKASVVILDAENSVGIIRHPVTGAQLGTVPATYGMHGWSFGDPKTYADFMGLKQAYDALLTAKGFSSPDTALVWMEVNMYLLSHNTRAAVSSVQCEDCHNTKQDGSFSSLVSPDGLFGEGNVATITTVADKRLVDMGMIILGQPYMKVDSNGVVTENVSDILYATKMNPSLSALNAEIAPAMRLAPKAIGKAEALGTAKIYNMVEITLLNSSHITTGDTFLFKPNYGDDAVKNLAIIAERFNDSGVSDLIFSSSRMEVAIADNSVKTSAKGAGVGGLSAEVYSIDLLDKQGREITTFNGEYIVIKLPYKGTNTNLEEVKILTSSDGSTWTIVDSSQIVGIQPASELNGTGYVLFATNHLSYYTIADSTITEAGDVITTSAGGGSSSGFCFIATAAYGSYEENHVQVLRDFRDQILLTNTPGQAFVGFYYKNSPPLADWIAKHETMRSIVRIMLWPLFALAYFLVKLSVAQQIMFTLMLIMTASSGLALYRKKREIS